MIKHPIKWYIYWKATKLRDSNIPVIEQVADWIRGITFNEDMWGN